MNGFYAVFLLTALVCSYAVEAQTPQFQPPFPPPLPQFPSPHQHQQPLLQDGTTVKAVVDVMSKHLRTGVEILNDRGLYANRLVTTLGQMLRNFMDDKVAGPFAEGFDSQPEPELPVEMPNSTETQERMLAYLRAASPAMKISTLSHILMDLFRYKPLTEQETAWPSALFLSTVVDALKKVFERYIISPMSAILKDLRNANDIILNTLLDVPNWIDTKSILDTDLSKIDGPGGDVANNLLKAINVPARARTDIARVYTILNAELVKHVHALGQRIAELYHLVCKYVTAYFPQFKQLLDNPRALITKLYNLIRIESYLDSLSSTWYNPSSSLL